MQLKNLLYKRSIDINEKIKLIIPTVRDVLANEDNYYSVVSMLTAMPIDMMVQLDDIGIDFTSIDEYELFFVLFGSIRQADTSLVFGDLDLWRFAPAISESNGKPVLINTEDDIVIDWLIHDDIASALRRIHGISKDIRKAGNEAAKDYLIERERKKMKRRARELSESTSNLEALIVAMVNTEQYKYNYEETLDLTIFQFNESVHQTIHKIDFDNKMHGVYSGTVSVKDLSQSDLNWLQHK